MTRLTHMAGMILYEVTLELDPTLSAEVETYMRGTHIPEILATGCFERIRLDRASPTRLRTCYQAASRAEMDRYLRNHAPKLRADFQARFPSGAGPSREVWESVADWVISPAGSR